MTKIICDGNEACAKASYLFTEVAGIYPITPSSPMPELIDKWAGEGKKNIFGEIPKVIEMQSEAGAISLVHGTLQTGILASTYTASQGLLLMLPNMYKIVGEMLPCTMHVAARTVATHALSIFGDQSDVYAVRTSGFCLLASSSVQDAYYLSLVSHLSSIDSSLPFLHFFDGFRTSHEINKIDILNEEDIKKMINYDNLTAFRKRGLDITNPVTKGTNQNADIYFQEVESRNIFYEKAVDKVIANMNKINSLAKTNYKPFNYYGNPKAKKIIIAMGSVCETIKETINYLKGEIGLIEVHLYRPFSAPKLLEVLPKEVEKIAVLDRAKEIGAPGEPLYLDVAAILKDKYISHGRYGLSSKDVTPGMIKAIYDMLDKPQKEFTIGIDDDITNLSLKYENINVTENTEILIYGYGSDGMVSTGKSLLKIAGIDKYVQGYFEYDSKKSGGVTCSHLRFSKNPIKSAYLVNNPNLIIISKDTYLSMFDPITKLNQNGKLLINTSMNEKELLDSLNPYKRFLKEKNIEVYKIDASEIARKNHLGMKISMIMEKAIFMLTNLIDVDEGTKKLEDYILKKFGPKSKSVALNNINALKDVNLIKIKLNDMEENLNFKIGDIYSAISHRCGNLLKVSDFKGYEDGTFKHKSPEKQNIAQFVPNWIENNCIQCSQCSLVCPHGVIRPFLLDEKEYQNAPEYIQKRCKKALGTPNHYYIIGISSKNCTGCGVCINTCPGMRGSKALEFIKLNESQNDLIFDYLVSNIKPKDIFPKNTIKGSQLVKPKFAFHGACAGCGETAYIKLLTQLSFNLVIANATGCSSIYGGELPNLPYSVPWANSLFEDNAEFAFGILMGYETGKKAVYDYMSNKKDELFDKWLNNPNNYEITKQVYEKIDYTKHPKLKELKNHIIAKDVWAIGGDGWAYDIGFGGIDHVLSSNSNINILVLNTEVYSNTGGQASKATPSAAVAQFASQGKKTYKKDLAKIAMSYPNVYVAQVSLGANMMQTIKAFDEAIKHQGPSIIIAYCPCISHGIKKGMGCSVEEEALATKCGYFPIFRYDGKTFTLDSPNPDFNLYSEFLENQTRYSMLKSVNTKQAKEMLEKNKEEAIKRFEYYKSLVKKQEV